MSIGPNFESRKARTCSKTGVILSAALEAELGSAADVVVGELRRSRRLANGECDHGEDDNDHEEFHLVDMILLSWIGR
tara:strand:+ start:4894 stop:5127 length:234 start_codon:yes stop_codon:yes gene_type:complete